MKKIIVASIVAMFLFSETSSEYNQEISLRREIENRISILKVSVNYLTLEEIENIQVYINRKIAEVDSVAKKP